MSTTATCEHCGEVITDPERAIYDGSDWYCNYRCMGAHSITRSGNVPA